MKRASRPFRAVAGLTASLAAILCAAALVPNGRSASAAPSAAATRSTVTISDYSFHPGVLTVARGTTVIWINKDDDVHIVKSKEGPASFQSPGLDSGGQYSFPFRRPGTYHYICPVHPYMRGTIIVK